MTIARMTVSPVLDQTAETAFVKQATEKTVCHALLTAEGNKTEIQGTDTAVVMETDQIHSLAAITHVQPTVFSALIIQLSLTAAVITSVQVQKTAAAVS